MNPIQVNKIRVETKEESEEQCKKYYCEVCRKEISSEESESYEGLCWECWDDQMTEECEFEEGII